MKKFRYFYLLPILLNLSNCNKSADKPSTVDAKIPANQGKPIAESKYRFGDFNGDGKIDTLLFTKIDNSLIKNPSVQTYNPFPDEKSERVVIDEIALGVYFGGLTSNYPRIHLLQDSSFFNSPNYSNRSQLWNLVRVIPKNSPDYELWKPFVNTDGDIIGLFTESSVEMSLFFDGHKFKAGFSDEEP